MFSQYTYMPILALSPAEMNGLEELPDKDKDLILPIIPLKGWVTSKNLESSLKRIEKAFGNRLWAADIEETFLENSSQSREVFSEIKDLLCPEDGYFNWFNFLKSSDNIIPVLQLEPESNIKLQIQNLLSLQRGLVIRLKHPTSIPPSKITRILEVLSEVKASNIVILLDYEKINKESRSLIPEMQNTIEEIRKKAPSNTIFSLSYSSFPSEFSGWHYGENSIYERQIFNELSQQCSNTKLIYSDRGSARAFKIGGGGGVPSPRIDYPLDSNWRFIRKEFADPKEPGTEEKKELYKKIAQEILKQDYWNPDLRVWGTRMIELTAEGEQKGIISPARATAVRINLHLHQQLHYNNQDSLLDTEEDWED